VSVFCGLVCGLSFDVLCSALCARLDAYGSAVAGLAISGLRGLRTGAAISELPADACDESMLLLDASLDMAEGGLAAPARAAPDRPATDDAPGVDLTGEKCA
jgi:hypothetical protein